MRQSLTNVLSHRHVVLLAAVLALGACGGDPEATDESAADLAAETADMEEAASDADDTSEGGGDASETAVMALPEWFPKDVYLPEAYSVVNTLDVGDVQHVELQVDSGVAELTEQARAGMQAHGWTEGAGTGESTLYTKAARNVMLTLNERDDGATRVGYQFSTP